MKLIKGFWGIYEIAEDKICDICDRDNYETDRDNYEPPKGLCLDIYIEGGATICLCRDHVKKLLDMFEE